MPVEPRKNESKEEFIQRCVAEEIRSGYENTQAVAICYSKWRDSKEYTKE